MNSEVGRRRQTAYSVVYSAETQIFRRERWTFGNWPVVYTAMERKTLGKEKREGEEEGPDWERETGREGAQGKSTHN